MRWSHQNTPNSGATQVCRGTLTRETVNDMVRQCYTPKRINAHAYPPPVWSPGEVVVNRVQISAANLAAGSYAVWMGMYSPLTQVRATVVAETVVVSEDRARLLEFQIGP